MIFKNGDCRYNREFFSNFTLLVNNGQLQMDMILVRQLVMGLKAHLSFEFRVSKSKTYQSLFQHDLNYCNMLKGNQQTLYRRLFLSMLKVGNFARSCPIQPGYYYLKGWTFNGDIVPSFLYLGDYRVGGSFYYGKYRRKTENPLLECTLEAILHN
ncbi:uncharacterized protein LOC132793504 [Drosophila nasuta]|uniref:uncharacterized protein LOC132793504 n=1 Tax=Drosophila nasuta TaxID=42062 RepID=UPI00295ECC67|nr:uncharacterized protein LOC132793504 [Drosophila nasuta]